MRVSVLFLKALKCLSLSISVIPLAGCAIATGLIFSNFLAGASENPDQEDQLFSITMLGFALIETFMLMTFIVIGIIYTF